MSDDIIKTEITPTSDFTAVCSLTVELGLIEQELLPEYTNESNLITRLDAKTTQAIAQHHDKDTLSLFVKNGELISASDEKCNELPREQLKQINGAMGAILHTPVE
jgi:hypothetical protein